MASGADFVQAAQSKLGDPYVYGATGPDSFDCSGLVQWAARQIGVTLPRTSQEQWQVGEEITAAALQPGDLVFSAGADGSRDAPGHVAIYAGGGRVVEAPHTGADVRYRDLANMQPTGYRRPPGLAGGGGGAAAGGGGVTPALDLFSLPGDVVKFFGTATDSLTASASFARAFFQPSTYVRIGAGVFGLVLLAAGLYFLGREAASAD